MGTGSPSTGLGRKTSEGLSSTSAPRGGSWVPVTTCSHGATPVRDCGSPRPHGPPGSARPLGRTASIPDSPRRGTSGRAAPASAPRGSALTPVRCASGRLFLENSRLEHSEDKSSVLGQGGSGTVIYRARYQGQPVAVKQFHIKKFKNFANAPAGNQPLRRRLSDRCCVQTSQSPEAAGGGGEPAGPSRGLGTVVWHLTGRGPGPRPGGRGPAVRFWGSLSCPGTSPQEQGSPVPCPPAPCLAQAWPLAGT